MIYYPRLIIVEGPDNCGKSTLAKQIAAVTGYAYWRLTSGPGLSEHKAMELYQSNALDNVSDNLDNSRGVVLDRHWPSDLVYGTVLRGTPSCNPERMRIRCENLGARYILCSRSNAIEEHASAKDPDHPYDDEIYASIVKGYSDWAFNNPTMPIYAFNLDSAMANYRYTIELIERVCR
jgi:hypothetical protein